MTEAGRDRELQVLDADECHRLLATEEIGRLGVNAERYPLIFPMNYALDGSIVVIRTDVGTKLSAADHANVAFEVDQIDKRSRVRPDRRQQACASQQTPDHEYGEGQLGQPLPSAMGTSPMQ